MQTGSSEAGLKVPLEINTHIRVPETTPPPKFIVIVEEQVKCTFIVMVMATPQGWGNV